MSENSYIFHFEGASSADANRYAEELRNVILDSSPDVSIQRKRELPSTQDFGSTLVVVLGTPAIVAVVNVIGNWLQMHSKASISVETSDKKLQVQNITSKEAFKLMEFFLQQDKENNKHEC